MIITLHRAFDRGLVSVSNDYRVLVHPCNKPYAASSCLPWCAGTALAFKSHRVDSFYSLERSRRRLSRTILIRWSLFCQNQKTLLEQVRQGFLMISDVEIRCLFHLWRFIIFFCFPACRVNNKPCIFISFEKIGFFGFPGLYQYINGVGKQVVDLRNGFFEVGCSK